MSQQHPKTRSEGIDETLTVQAHRGEGEFPPEEDAAVEAEMARFAPASAPPRVQLLPRPSGHQFFVASAPLGAPDLRRS